MNRALPPGDRGHRGRDSGGQLRPRWIVSAARGLVYRIAIGSEREMPLGGYPAAQERREERSGFDGVGPLAVIAFGRRHSQAHFLADRARKEAAHGMWLPARSFHELFGCDATGPLQQVQDLVGLAALAGRAGLLPRLGSSAQQGPFCWVSASH